MSLSWSRGLALSLLTVVGTLLIGSSSASATAVGGVRRIHLGLLLAALSAAFLLAPASPAAAFFEVTVTKAGSGAAAATVTSEPAGIDCGTECGPHNFGLAAVKLTATPGPGDVFAGWSGASCDGGPKSNPCEFLFSFTNLADRNFTATFAPPPSPPHAATGAAGSVGESGATMNGEVNPNGSAVEECRFEYGSTTAYGASLPCVPGAAELGEGNADEAVSAQAEHLEPGVTYHYRLVAGNFGGSSEGADMTFTTAGTPVCPNVDRRTEQGISALLLPGCMALEMVSPPKKFGANALAPVISSVDPDRIHFLAKFASEDAEGYYSPFGGEPYVASRGVNGWISTPTPPSASHSLPGNEVFSPNFSRWLSIVAPTDADRQAGVAQVIAKGLGSPSAPLSPRLVPFGENLTAQSFLSVVTRGISMDLSHLFLHPQTQKTRYFSEDPVPAGTEGRRNLYVAHLDAGGAPTVALVARDSDGRVWGRNCGAMLGGGLKPENGEGGFQSFRTQGAVSADGTRVYFSTRAGQPATGNCTNSSAKMRILKRVEAGEGPWISEPIKYECARVAPALACKTEGEANGNDLFQAASQDGTKLYFMTNRQLASSDLDGTNNDCSFSTGVLGCDLYLYDSTRPAGARLTQVSAGEVTATHPTVGEAAKALNGTVAVSADGSHAYFVAEAALTGANGEGKSPSTAAGARNLYLFQRNGVDDDLTFIASLAAGDERFLWGGDDTYANRAFPVPVSGDRRPGGQPNGDGHILVFQTKATLLPDDADAGRLDVYRYDSEAEQMICVTCRPGGPDDAPFDVVSATAASFIVDNDAALGTVRWASEDGESITFKTAEEMIPGQASGITHAYIWRHGDLYALPGTADPNDILESTGGGPPRLAPDGSEVVFLSLSPLLPIDGDVAADVYVARAEGGFENPKAPVICAGESCQAPFQVKPQESGVETSVPRSGGQVPRCAKRRVFRHGRCVKRRRCARKRVFRHSRCVKRKRDRGKKHHKAHHKHVGDERRGRK